MHQENRPAQPSRSTPSSAKDPSPALQGARSGSKPSASAAGGQSLTAKMLDYRSWWNLPRSRSRKQA